MTTKSTTIKGTSPAIRVAIVGTRGIPNGYGGFETFAEEMSQRLTDLGCAVVVYCRSNYFTEKPATYKGAKLVYLPTLAHQALDTFFHTFISIWHVIFKNTADTVLLVNVGNAPFALLAKLFGKKVIFCVDGLDWQRKKWGTFARWYLRACSYLAGLASHEVVTDAASVQAFYKTERQLATTLIPYGTDIETDISSGTEVLREYNLEPKKYFTYVARFEPENNPLLVVQAHAASGSPYPLVMIGDNRYNPALVESVKAAANDKVIFLGYVFGARYKQLVKHSIAYIRAAEVGGASPAIIEAMGRGVAIIANDKPENRETLTDTGYLYKLSVPDLARTLKNVSDNPARALELGARTQQRAMLVYSWDRIAYEYVKLMKKYLPQADTAEEIAVTHNSDKKRILMVGAGGMLGEAMYKHFATDYTVVATDKDVNEPWLSFLDVRDFKAYEKAVESLRPDYIFHLAALTNLEDCEKDTANSYTTNALSAKYAAQLATRYNAKLIYISSAGVFDGAKKFYTEDDEPNPINTYALTKQMGALFAEYYAKDNLVLRPGWMMGGGPKKDKKFVNSIIQQIVAGEKTIHAVTDKLGTPSYTHDIARQLEALLKEDATGIYHTVCRGFTSRYEVAKEIVKILGYTNSIKVVPVDSSYFAHTFYANRPHSENLVNDRLGREGTSLMNDWQSALKEYLERDFEYAFNPDRGRAPLAEPLTQAT